MVSTMSTIESYGVVGDGGGSGGFQNNTNLGHQPSQPSGASAGLMSTMQLSYTTGGAAVYKPVMPPSSPIPALATNTPPTFQVGGAGAVAAPPLPSVNATVGEQTKRKRGRPRKYAVDDTTAPILTSPPPLALPETGLHSSGFSSPDPTAVSPSGKKPRGRPPGSGRKQQVATFGSPGVGFTPHIITVKAGEDVSSKIMSFSQNGKQAICIMSATGSISNVTLRQSATSGGTVTYEGRFEILSLSGSYMLLESGGQRSRTGGLSVVLSGPDGRVLGGGVAGLLTAAAPVQVVVGSFVPGQEFNSPIQADPLASVPKLNAGASGAGSPASRGTLSESSGGNGSPAHNQNTGPCNNTNPQGMTSFSWK